MVHPFPHFLRLHHCGLGLFFPMMMMMVFLHTVSCWFHICRFCSYKRHFWLVSILWITVGCCTRLRWLKWKTIRKIYANGNWDGDWWGKRNAINRKPKPVKIRIAPSTKIVAVYCLLASEFWNAVVLVLTMVNKRQQLKTMVLHTQNHRPSIYGQFHPNDSMIMIKSSAIPPPHIQLDLKNMQR